MNLLFGSVANPTEALLEKKGAGLFPFKAALALLTAVAVLVSTHFWRDRTHGLDPTVLADAVRLKWPHRPVSISASMPLNGLQQTQAQSQSQSRPGSVNGQSAQNVGAPQAISTVMADDFAALDPFYAQLWTLEQNRAPQVVTVLHYGDSPTTADLITGDIRSILQERFGDAGHGFNLAAKPWAWYGHRYVEISDKGWDSSQKDATGVGRMKQSVYGLGGAIFSGSVGAQTTYTLKDAAVAPQTAVDVQFLAGPNAGSFTVFANDASLANVGTAAPAAVPATRTMGLPAGTKTIRITVDSGTVKVFGVDFRRGDRGVIYDSMGLNGATTTVISRTFDAAAWGPELAHAKPSLIVVNYGTNESQFSGLVQTLDKELRAAVDKTRAAAPGVPILIMSPMDRGEHGGLNDIHTNPAIPQIVAIQQKVAAETHCAFFDTYAAMGGDGTMARWYAAKPRLVTADLIHPTPDGAVLVAQMFVDNLYRGYDRWKHAHGIGVVMVMGPSEVAAKKKAAAAKAKAEAKAAREATRAEQKVQGKSKSGTAPKPNPAAIPDGMEKPAPASPATP